MVVWGVFRCLTNVVGFRPRNSRHLPLGEFFGPELLLQGDIFLTQTSATTWHSENRLKQSCRHVRHQLAQPSQREAVPIFSDVEGTSAGSRKSSAGSFQSLLLQRCQWRQPSRAREWRVASFSFFRRLETGRTPACSSLRCRPAGLRIYLGSLESWWL